MRIDNLVFLALGAVACSAPPARETATRTTLGKAEPAATTGGSDPDAHRVLSGDAGARGAPPTAARSDDGVSAPPNADADGDGVPDAIDCEPSSAALGARIVEDDLATADGLVEAAPGFDSTAWRHQDGAYRQEVLHDAEDVSFLTASLSLSLPPAFSAEVQVAATQLGSFSPTLRQLFLVVGGSSDANGISGFSGFGCGVEKVEGANPPYKASLVHLSGGPLAVATDPIRREDADPLTAGGAVAITVLVTSGNLTCTVVQSGRTTTLAIPGVGVLSGAVGFATRQAKAAFSKIRICQVPA